MPALSILYKKYDEAVISAVSNDLTPIFKHANKVYLILMMSALLATSGAALEIFSSFGTKLWFLNFVISIWWLFYVDQNNIISSVLAFGAYSLCFGATVTSLLHTVSSLDEWDILIVCVGAAIIFCFNLLALRTRSLILYLKIHYFNVPISISFLVAMSYLLQNVPFPKVLFAIPGYIVGIPLTWFIGFLVFRNRNWVRVPIHCHFLSILFVLTKYDVFFLLGMYFIMFGFVLNSNMHLYDVIFTVNALDGADFHPIPLVFSFYYEFVGRSSYLAFFSGRSLWHSFWNSNQAFLIARWEEMCNSGARLGVYLNEVFFSVLRHTYDFVMTWFVRAWCFSLPLVTEFKGYLLDFKAYFTNTLLISFGFAFLSVNVFIFVSSRVQAN